MPHQNLANPEDAVKPTLIVIAGPNGAGKTTVTMRLQADH
jgi:uridine kinase